MGRLGKPMITKKKGIRKCLSTAVVQRRNVFAARLRQYFLAVLLQEGLGSRLFPPFCSADRMNVFPPFGSACRVNVSRPFFDICLNVFPHLALAILMFSCQFAVVSTFSYHLPAPVVIMFLIISRHPFQYFLVTFYASDAVSL